jgi:branched-subunit amino acid ABC-type transport system permease component
VLIERVAYRPLRGGPEVAMLLTSFAVGQILQNGTLLVTRLAGQPTLIAFPTRELFSEKIKDFDLIIFDRYQHRDVLPILYYDYISEYVEKGGALLIAAGPEYAGEQSIARTPLVSALPPGLSAPGATWILRRP